MKQNKLKKLVISVIILFLIISAIYIITGIYASLRYRVIGDMAFGLTPKTGNCVGLVLPNSLPKYLPNKKIEKSFAFFHYAYIVSERYQPARYCLGLRFSFGE